jgi:hypothetical protein
MRCVGGIVVYVYKYLKLSKILLGYIFKKSARVWYALIGENCI